MTKLTTERLEEIAKLEITEFSNGMDIAKDAYQSVGSSEIVLMARQLLAYEQAAEHPAARITWDGSEFSVSNVSEDFLYGGTAVYLAPVLPKQPELVMKHSSVIAEQLDGVISSMDVTDHQRAVISCAIDRLNKNAEILQKKTTALIAPETLDYQSAKELFNYLMNEEETNATVNGWNACRAEMLKAQPVSEPYKLKDAVEDIRNSGVEIDADKIKAERDALNSPVIPDSWKLVPVEPTAEMAQAARDCHEGESFLPYSIYRAMLAVAPAQEQK